MQQVTLTHIDELPMYTLPYRNALRCGFERILGFQFLGGQAAFPAYAPFGSISANDIRLVFPDAEWSDNALQAERLSLASDLLISNNQDTENIVTPAAIDGLTYTLPPFIHQQETLSRAFLHPRIALLLDCGLGKTKVSIDLIRACKLAGEDVRALVVAPSGLIVTNWGQELELHAPELRYETATTKTANLLSKPRRAKLYKAMAEDPPEVFVTTYGSLVNDSALIRDSFKHTILICDESHSLQTPVSKRTKAVLSFATCKRRVILSGTASQGSPEHLYGQLAVLAPWLVGDLWKFKRRFLQIVDGYMCGECHKRWEEMPQYRCCATPNCFSTSFTTHTDTPTCRHCHVSYAEIPMVKGCKRCENKSLRRVAIVKGFRNLNVLNRVVARVSIRKSAAECLNLPPLRTIDMPYNLPANAKKAYNALVRRTTADLVGGRTVSSPAAAQRIMRLLQILSGHVRDDEGDVVRVDDKSKLEAGTGLLQSILASDDSKIIIWGHFTESLNIAAGLLEKLDIQYVRVDGKTKNRETLRKTFETDPQCRVYLGQIQTGIGINLVAANYMIYWDLPFFNWSHYEQSLKRMHRIGQKRPSTVYRLYVPGSVHDYVREVLDMKDSIVKSLINRNLCAMCALSKTCREKEIEAFDPACKMANANVTKTTAILATL